MAGSTSEHSASSRRESILVVDDEPGVRRLLQIFLTGARHECRTAKDGAEALSIVAEEPRPVVVLSDVEMPGMSGLELLERLKVLDPHMQVIMVSGVQSLDIVRKCLVAGAYDYIIKPFEQEDLLNTVERAIERGRLIRQNEEYRRHLERMVEEQTVEIRQTRDMALLTLAKLAESRDAVTGQHLERMAAYSRRLAAELAQGGPYQSQISDEFVEDLFKSSPLHDIGKVGIPDAILCKPGPLDDAELAIMRTHPLIGGDTLRQVIDLYSARTFLTMGMEIAYYHHERWDGRGYPWRVAGELIPLPARIVALADAYDAITSERPYKPAYDHQEAVRRIIAGRGNHFDPVIVDAFLACHLEFAAIHAELVDQMHREEAMAS
ncbi:MAG TPA: HD domain-containing phosphohydrolase [Thermoanaerobaculia bacterium]|nr:HD domain-containing phosphohydrolase [Thermoanaerobaculia bacterium]